MWILTQWISHSHCFSNYFSHKLSTITIITTNNILIINVSPAVYLTVPAMAVSTSTLGLASAPTIGLGSIVTSVSWHVHHHGYHVFAIFCRPRGLFPSWLCSLDWGSNGAYNDIYDWLLLLLLSLYHHVYVCSAVQPWLWLPWDLREQLLSLSLGLDRSIIILIIIITIIVIIIITRSKHQLSSPGPTCTSRSCSDRCEDHGQCSNGSCVCQQGWNGK